MVRVQEGQTVNTLQTLTVYIGTCKGEAPNPENTAV